METKRAESSSSSSSHVEAPFPFSWMYVACTALNEPLDLSFDLFLRDLVLSATDEEAQAESLEDDDDDGGGIVSLCATN